MSSCIRRSQKELSGSYYPASYISQPSLANKGVDTCRRNCISADDDLCRVWRYTTDGVCAFAPQVNTSTNKKSLVQDTSTMVCGLVACDKQVDVFTTLLILMAIVSVCVLLIVYLMYCNPSRRNNDFLNIH